MSAVSPTGAEAAISSRTSAFRWWWWFSTLFVLGYLALGLVLGVVKGGGIGIGDTHTVHTIDGKSPLHLHNPQP